MNKKDVLSIVEFIASDTIFKDFAVRKSDNSIILKSGMGNKRVQFWHYNSYDLKRDGLALEITPYYKVRFDVLHKWFEKYSKRTKKDQRDDYSVCFNGSMAGSIDEFYFLESRKDYNHDLQILYNEVVKNAKYVFSKFSTLVGYYEYCIIDVLNGSKELPDEGFEWVTEYLIATKLVAPANYDKVKNLILQRAEWMMERNNPNMILYYNDLPMILQDLEQTDFASGKWGEID